MRHIIPAVIPQSFDYLEDTLASIRPFTNEVQIDIVDGVFVPFTSWPHKGGKIADLVTFTTDFDIEMDLMVKHPEEVLREYAETGVKSIVIHLESVSDFAIIQKEKANHGFKLGLSILNDSPLSLLEGYLEDADYVQLMGIAQIGSQGQPFDERVLDRIRELRAKSPNLMISIDGSVNETTIPLLKEAGANRFVSGSAILKSSNPEETFLVFERLAS